jgi:hypothetical protein
MTRVQMAAQIESISGPQGTFTGLLGVGRHRAATARCLAGDRLFLGFVDIEVID